MKSTRDSLQESDEEGMLILGCSHCRKGSVNLQCVLTSCQVLLYYCVARQPHQTTHRHSACCKSLCLGIQSFTTSKVRG